MLAAALLRAAAVATLALAACDRKSTVSSCDDDLGGVWLASDNGKWMVVDNRKTLEIYPLFDDSVPDGAPRVIDVARPDMAGNLKRRFMRRAETCDARAPFRITGCKADALQIVRGDLSPPLTFGPCTWPQTAPSRVETWRRGD